MPGRRLILIRHSVSEIQPEVPPAFWRLSAEGIARARAFAARVDPGSAACVFSSPEPKAVETARLLGEAWNVPVEEVQGLQEHERPDAVMLPRETFEERVRDVFAHPSRVVFGSESADEARGRFTEAVRRVVARSAGDVVIVSHGTVMALFVGAEAGVDPFAFWKRQEMPFAVTLALPALTLDETTFLTSAVRSAGGRRHRRSRRQRRPSGGPR